MQRRDLSKILLASAAAPAAALISSTAAAQSCTPPCFPRIPEESGAPATLDLSYPPGDIRRYGASTATSTNKQPIEDALEVSAAGGPSAYVPQGNWKYTAAITVPGRSSLRGEGICSVLEPIGCDGIQFSGQDTVGGARSFRDFAIIGADTASNSGVKCDLDSGAGGRITGVLFENIYIEGFGVGVYARGMWNCSFIRCYLFSNFTGFYLFMRSIDTTILNTSIVRGTVGGSGESRGIVTAESASLRPEDVRVIGSFVYGYDVNIDMSRQLNGSIIACDLDNALKIGVRLTQVDGGCSVTDNYIATGDSTLAIAGVEVVALGAPRNSNLAIENNHIVCNNPTTGTAGIRIGSNQNMVRAIGNRVTGFYDGIYNNAGNNVAISGNSINATSRAIFLYTASGCSDCEVGVNYVENGVPLTFSAATPPRFRYQDYGSFTATVTGCTSAPSGTVPYNANGSTVRLRFPDITGTSNSSAATVTGVPTIIRPRVNQIALARVMNNGVSAFAATIVRTDGSIMLTADANGSAFTASGGKGVTACEIEYSLDA